MVDSRRRLGLVAVVLGSLALPTVADAAAKKFTVTGRLTGSDPTFAVLLVANDGSSVRVDPDASGRFTVKVPSKIAKSFVVQRTGKGATLHILKSGEYAGPVVLGKATKTKGYTRLTSKKSGTVSVGTIAMKTGYAIGKASKTVVDTSSTVRMKNDAPVGSQGVLDQMVMGPVTSFGTLTDDAAAIGADADRDGLPNFADGDVNGDGILDAAQPSTATEFQGLQSRQALVNRPRSNISFNKILQEDEVGLQINSNLNPAVTEDQIRQYLERNLSIETLLPFDSFSTAEFEATKVLVDCRKLSYCTKETPGFIDRGLTDADGKTMAEIQDANGIITMPKRRGENTYLLRFYPRAASAAAGNLTGDTFELIRTYNGQVVSSEAKVVTSSVAAPMAFASVDGKLFDASSRPKFRTNVISNASAIPVTFHRPQAFAEGSSSRLVDRGGLKYFVSLWPLDQSNTGYPCPMSSLSSLSPTLLKTTATGEYDQSMFDSDQSPAANGTQLGFTLDAKGCMAAQRNSKHTMASGQRWTLEFEAQDADSNKVRIGLEFLVP